MVVSALLFGVVHAEFVEGAGAADDGTAGASSTAAAPATSAGGVQDTKEYWFRVTALYGALYSLLYIVAGHRLLAPACAHAGLNVGLCVRDWGRMRSTPYDELKRVFADGED